MGSRAIFLDKDGTLVEDLPYNVNPDLMRLAPGALEALRLLYRAGYSLFVVTNQSGVARGLFTEADLLPLESRLRALLRAGDVPLAGLYYCPHHPQGKVSRYRTQCSCRKPKPGMLLRAAQEHQIDLAGSWMVGDILDDVEAGNQAGCRTALLNNGHETEWKLSRLRRPGYMVKDLPEAARAIIDVDGLEEWSFFHGSKAQRSSTYH